MGQVYAISITDLLLIIASMVGLVVFIGFLAKEDTKLMRRWIKETEDLKAAEKAKEALKKEQAKEEEKSDTKDS